MKSKSVLIVEDNDLNRRFFENLVGQIWNYETALNGREAIDKASNKAFDLILMDIQMPEIDGINALKKIRAKGQGKCPIIAVTAFADESDRTTFMNEGFDDFITKPIRPKEFLKKIKDALEDKPKDKTNESKNLIIKSIIFDKSVFEQLKKYNKTETIQQIYQDFLEEAKALLEDCKKAILEGNHSEVTRKSHIIKGNAGTLGINLVFFAATETEALGRKEEFEKMPAALLKLEKEIETFQKYLEEEIIFKP
ncbi:MAG: response regulator [Algoriphagus sp.]|uniref:response regulator n=1 Tax=Algoriphagus sp. TaxID=1872435 RepID=UPI0017F08A6A|nr:hybrid sensor histidine kinase/response regulator [Algoriphagus sp.]NVJ87034.1 response regulator [Algoriphagus sp.]